MFLFIVLRRAVVQLALCLECRWCLVKMFVTLFLDSVVPLDFPPVLAFEWKWHSVKIFLACVGLPPWDQHWGEEMCQNKYCSTTVIIFQMFIVIMSNYYFSLYQISQKTNIQIGVFSNNTGFVLLPVFFSINMSRFDSRQSLLDSTSHWCYCFWGVFFAAYLWRLQLY